MILEFFLHCGSGDLIKKQKFRTHKVKQVLTPVITGNAHINLGEKAGTGMSASQDQHPGLSRLKPKSYSCCREVQSLGHSAVSNSEVTRTGCCLPCPPALLCFIARAAECPRLPREEYATVSHTSERTAVWFKPKGVNCVPM